MDQRRYIIFLVSSLAFMLFWWQVVVPQFMPPQPKGAEKNAAEQGAPADAGEPGLVGEPGETGDKKDASADDKDNSAATADTKPGAENAVQNTADVNFEAAEETSVVLGSLDPESGYFMQVELQSLGASVDSVKLNHPRFRELDDREQPIELLGDSQTDYRTLSTSISKIDDQLKKKNTSLAEVSWEVESTVSDPANNAIKTGVTFRFRLGDLEVRKSYRIQPVENEAGKPADLWDTNSTGYTIDCDLTFLNHAKAPVELDYHLQGPVGIRLENREHTRKYRDVKVGIYRSEDSDTTKIETVYSKTIYESAQESAEEGLSFAEANQELAKEMGFETAFKYVAVDVQFFAAVLSADDDRDIKQKVGNPRLVSAAPMLIQGNPRNASYSDISFKVKSQVVTLPAAGEKAGSLTHKFKFYTGPKREVLVSAEPFAAADIMDYGWFGFIARRMVGLLRFLNRLGFPYAIAIILMTMMVRGFMYPFSRKQAMGAKKMKELQPELTALKAKYADDKEKMARAQMELFRKHNYNPFAGCVPVVFQMPIFIGLYTALNAAVDLRLQPFLWADNLAAPDRLFRMPFELPFLGQDFNLLPLFTVVLFSLQQKMFMPPPTDEQQAMQQKMMSYMTLFFGFLFWHVPAGLCVYFIASSIWGLCERLALDWGKGAKPALATGDAEAAAVIESEGQSKKGNNKPGNGNNPKNGKKDPAQMGFLERMAHKLNEAAEQARDQAQTSNREAGRGRPKGNKGKGKKKK